MIRLLYIECGVVIQKDWMNGVDRLQRAFVWYDGARFWVERGDDLVIPRKGESRWVEDVRYAEAEPMPRQWNATLRTQMRGYHLTQMGEEVWCADS
jgi:hypothetical protein